MKERIGIITDSTCEYEKIIKMFKDALVLSLTFFINGKKILDQADNHQLLMKHQPHQMSSFYLEPITTESYIKAFETLRHQGVTKIVCLTSSWFDPESAFNAKLAIEISGQNDVYILDCKMVQVGYLSALESLKDLLERGIKLKQALPMVAALIEQQVVYVTNYRRKNLFSFLTYRLIPFRRVYQLSNQGFILTKRSLKADKINQYLINEVKKHGVFNQQIKVFLFYKTDPKWAKMFYQDLYQEIPSVKIVIEGPCNFSLGRLLEETSIGVMISQRGDNQSMSKESGINLTNSDIIS